MGDETDEEQFDPVSFNRQFNEFPLVFSSSAYVIKR